MRKEQREYEIQNSRIVVDSSSSSYSVTVREKNSSLRTELSAVPQEEHGKDLFNVIVVGGPHYRNKLSDDERDVVDEAIKKHFRRCGILNSDEAYYNMVGEAPPYNPDMEGFDMEV